MFKALEGARKFMTTHYLKVNRCVPPPIATARYVRDEYTNYDTSALSAQSFLCIAQMAFLLSTGRFAETTALDVSHCRCPSWPYTYGDYKLQRIALLHRLYRLNMEDTELCSLIIGYISVSGRWEIGTANMNDTDSVV